MNMSDNYRQIQEERDLIDRSLPALFPGKVRAPLAVCPDCAALATQHRHSSKSVSEVLSGDVYQSHSESFSLVSEQSFQGHEK